MFTNFFLNKLSINTTSIVLFKFNGLTIKKKKTLKKLK